MIDEETANELQQRIEGLDQVQTCRDGMGDGHSITWRVYPTNTVQNGMESNVVDMEVAIEMEFENDEQYVVNVSPSDDNETYAYVQIQKTGN